MAKSTPLKTLAICGATGTVATAWMVLIGHQYGPASLTGTLSAAMLLMWVAWS